MQRRTNYPVGKVVDVKDPLFQQRIRVRLPGVHDDVPDDNLPWALPQTRVTGSGASQAVPKLGSKVYLNIDDPHEPVYLGNALAKDKLPAPLKVNYPSREGYVTDKGTFHYIDEKSGISKSGGESGWSHTVSKDGKLTTESPKQVVQKVQGGSSVTLGPSKTDIKKDVALTGSQKTSGDSKVTGKALSGTLKSGFTALGFAKSLGSPLLTKANILASDVKNAINRATMSLGDLKIPGGLQKIINDVQSTIATAQAAKASIQAELNKVQGAFAQATAEVRGQISGVLNQISQAQTLANSLTTALDPSASLEKLGDVMDLAGQVQEMLSDAQSQLETLTTNFSDTVVVDEETGDETITPSPAIQILNQAAETLQTSIDLQLGLGDQFQEAISTDSVTPTDGTISDILGLEGNSLEIKRALGLENVNNTSDRDKPLSNAGQRLLDQLNRRLSQQIQNNVNTIINVKTNVDALLAASGDITGAIDAAASAANSAIAAANALNNAQLAAQNAIIAQDAASASRQAALTAQTQAEASALAAANSVTSAAGYASTAQAAVTIATQKADEASTSASIASASVTLAQTAAGQASIKASEAAISATDAQGYSISAFQNSTLAAQSVDAIKTALSDTLTSTFGSGGRYHTVYDRTANTRSVDYDLPGVSYTLAGNLPVAQFDGLAKPGNKKLNPIEPEQSYRVDVALTRTVGSAPIKFGFALFGANGTYIGRVESTISAALNTRVTPSLIKTGAELLAAFPSTSSFSSFLEAAVGVTANSGTEVIQVSSLGYATISSEVRSQGYATASAQSASSAAISATNASTFAGAAQQSLLDAQTAAGQAQTFRNDAATSATNAAGSASTASQASGVASSSAADALAFRDQASGFATAASNSASTATTQASLADTRASAAQTSATNAQTSAGQASTSAGQASVSETNASGSAQAAAQSATTSATARDSARLAAQSTVPDNFTDPANWIYLNNWGGTSQIVNGVLKTFGGGSVYSTFSLPVSAGQTYRFTMRHRVVNQGGGASYLGFLTVPNGDLYWLVGEKGSAPLNQWEITSSEISGDTILATFPGTTAVRIVVLLGYPTVSDAECSQARMENITSELASRNSASAASNSASTAAASADLAGQRASAAQLSATQADTSRAQAQTFSGQASTSASNANTSAGQASNSATAAQTSSVNARLSAATVLPSTLTDNGNYFTTAGTGAPSAVTPVTSLLSLSSDGPVVPSNLAINGYIGTVGLLPHEPGKTYDLEAKLKCVSATGAVPVAALWYISLDANYNVVSSQVTNDGGGIGAWTNTPVNQLTSVTFRWTIPAVEGAVWHRMAVLFNRNSISQGTINSGSVVNFISLAIRDATSAAQAAGSASAAAVSAQNASVSETNAGQSATSAQTSATLASTRAGEALTYRNDAASSASSAAGSASSAQTQAGISATARDASLNARDTTISTVAATLPDATNSGTSQFFSSNYDGPPTRATGFDLNYVFQPSYVEINGNGTVTNRDFSHLGAIRLAPNRRYRLTASWRAAWSDNRSFIDGALFFIGLNASYSSIYTPGQSIQVSPATGGWGGSAQFVTSSFEFDGNALIAQGCIWLRGLFRLWDATGNQQVHLSSLKLEDITSETNAANSATAAAGSASSASASANAAGQQATAAQNERVAAQTARADAQTFASNAAGSATNAQGSASVAQTQAGLSATARDASQRAARSARPTTFEDEALYFDGDYGQTAPFNLTFYDDPGLGTKAAFVTDTNGYGGYGYISWDSFEPLVYGNNYKVRARIFKDAGATRYFSLRVGTYNSAQSTAERVGLLETNVPVTSSGWQWIEATFTANLPGSFIRPELVLNYTPTLPGLNLYASALEMENVTSEVRAQTAANASFQSSQTSIAKANEAGQYASSANESRNQAAAQAGSAASHASAAAGSAALSTGAASEARQYVTLASQWSSQSLNKNPYFADPAWTGGQGTLPTNYGLWANDGGAYFGPYGPGGLNPYGSRSVQFDRSGVNQGFYQTIYNMPPGWYVAEFDVSIQDGSWRGLGGYIGVNSGIGWDFGSVSDINKDVGDIYPGGSAIQNRKFSFLFRNDSFASSSNFHAMIAWEGFANRYGRDVGFVRSIWHKMLVRPATGPEITAQEASNNASANTAAINDERAIRTSETGALASRAGSLETRMGSAEGNIGNISSRVSATEQAISDGRFAAASRVSAIEANYSSGSGNLVANSELLASAAGQWPYGWSWGAVPGATWDNVGVNLPDQNYYLPTENVVCMHKNGDNSAGFIYAEWASQDIPVKPNDWLQFYALYNAHRCSVAVFLYYKNSAGQIIANSPIGSGPLRDRQGNIADGYAPIGVASTQVPAGATSAVLILRHNGDTTSNGESWAWFWRPYVSLAREGQTSFNAYSVGQGRSAINAANARITETSQVLTNQIGAVASRASTLESQMTGSSGSGLLTLLDTNRRNLFDLGWWKAGAPIPWVLNGGARNEIHPVDGSYAGIQVATPDGSAGDIWLTQADAGGNNGGGWDGAYTYPLDPDKTYRFMVQIAPLGTTERGMYWGAQGVCDLNTTALNGNPYFAVSGSIGLSKDRWYLFVGYIFPRYSTGRSNEGAGVWDMQTGNKIAGGTNFCFHPDGRQPYFRAYQFYAQAWSYQAFGRPIAELVDGNETPVFSSLKSLKGVTTTNARIDSLATTVATNQAAAATRVDTLEATVTNSSSGNLVKKPTFIDYSYAGWTGGLGPIGSDGGMPLNPGFPFFARFTNRDNVCSPVRKDWSNRVVRVRGWINAVESDWPIGLGFFARNSVGGVIEYCFEQIVAARRNEWVRIDYIRTVPGNTAIIDPWVWVQDDVSPATGANSRAALVSYFEITDVTDQQAVTNLDARVSTQQGAIVDLQGKTSAAWWRASVAVPGAEGTFELAAANGASRIAMRASYIALGNLATPALEVVSNNVRLNGNLYATAGIEVGSSGNTWAIAFRPKIYRVTDGQIVDFGLNIGRIPVVNFSTIGLDPLNSGETYKLYADALSATGFIARLRINTPAAQTNYNIGGATAPGSGPTLQIDKSSLPDAPTGEYTVTYTGTATIRNPNEYEPAGGSVSIAVYVMKSGAWTLATVIDESIVGRLGEEFTYTNFNGTAVIQLGGGVQKVGLSISAYSGVYDNQIILTGFTSLAWTAAGAPSSERTATSGGQTVTATVTP